MSDFDSVIIRPQRTTLYSRSQVNLLVEYTFYHSGETFQGIPIICANMGFASYDLAQELEKHTMITCLHKYHNYEEVMNKYASGDLNPKYTWITMGMSEEDLISLEDAFDENDNINNINICIDVANGHMERFVNFCSRVRNSFPGSIIMAGNVAIPEMTQELIIHGGVDIVKLGIGPGANCTTRRMTGVGVPQLVCLEECSSSAHGLMNERSMRSKGRVCSDGGCKYPGDVAKAFVAGADFVMLGSMFAGCSESSGEWRIIDGHEHLVHYGMSSHYAQQKHYSEIKKYRASEGIVSYVKDKGPVSNVIDEILGGLRSCGTYIGASDLNSFKKCGKFINL
jgi:GMP reductase